MARRVSGGGMSAGVSVAALATVIVVFLVCLGVAYGFFISKEKVRWEVARVKQDAAQRKTEAQKAYEATVEVQRYLDNHATGKDVKQYLESLSLDKHEVETEERTLEELTFKKALDTLDLAIFRYKLAVARLEMQLKDTKGLVKVTAAATEADRQEFAKLAEEKQAYLAQLDAFKVNEDKRKEDVVKKYNEEQAGFDSEYRNIKDEHDKKKSGLISETNTNAATADVARTRIAFLSPTPPLRPPDGHVLGSDWQTHKVVVDIGSVRGVFPGLVMAVYQINSVGKQEVKGRLQVMKVTNDSSTCSVLDENAKQPIVKGDTLHVPFIAIPDKKRFVVVGVFSPEAVYTRDQVIGLIKLNGGIVQDHVALDTDYVIKGETGVSAGATKEGAAEAEQAATARHELQEAKEMSIKVVDYLDFISYIRQ